MVPVGKFVKNEAALNARAMRSRYSRHCARWSAEQIPLGGPGPLNAPSNSGPDTDPRPEPACDQISELTDHTPIFGEQQNHPSKVSTPAGSGVDQPELSTSEQKAVDLAEW
jgi:hypothetical protein